MISDCIKVTYVIASTTPEDAYPAQKIPGLLCVDYYTGTIELIPGSLDHRPTREGS
jgi:hypothetical protein